MSLVAETDYECDSHRHSHGLRWASFLTTLATVTIKLTDVEENPEFTVTPGS